MQSPSFSGIQHTILLYLPRREIHLPSALSKQPVFVLPSVSCRKITFVLTNLSAWTTAEFLLEFSFLLRLHQHCKSLVKMKSAVKKEYFLLTIAPARVLFSYSFLAQRCVTLRLLNICHVITAAGITGNQLNNAKGRESGRETAFRAQTKHCPAPSQLHLGANLCWC